MSGIGNKFHPSRIEDKIYNIINEEQYLVSSSEYTEEAIAAVESMLARAEANLIDCLTQWNIIYDNYPDDSGASVSIAWVEAGHLHHIVLNIRY